MDEVKSYNYHLRDAKGNWLGQIVLTDDGMFASVTDWGNFSFGWRSFGDDFKKFLIGINVGYFSTKMRLGIAYMASSKKIAGFCDRYAENILPALQEALKKELVSNN